MLKHTCTYLATFVVFCGGLLATATPPASAQSTSIVPDDAAWVMRMQPSVLASSEFGEVILEAFEEEEPEKLEFVEGVSDALGIDLLEGLGEVTLFGKGFLRSHTQIAVDLGEQPGNLEGLLIAVPGYQSTEYRGQMLIHSIPSDDAKAVDPLAERLYIAIVQHPADNRWVALAAHLEPNLKAMASAVLDDQRPLASAPLGEGVVFHAAVLKNHGAMLGENSEHNHIAQMIDRLDLTGQVYEDVTLSLKVSVVSALRARQVSQLLQGLIAGVQIAGINDPAAERLGMLLQDATVDWQQGSSEVHATTVISPDTILDLRPGELDL